MYILDCWKTFHLFRSFPDTQNILGDIQVSAQEMSPRAPSTTNLHTTTGSHQATSRSRVRRHAACLWHYLSCGDSTLSDDLLVLAGGRRRRNSDLTLYTTSKIYAPTYSDTCKHTQAADESSSSAMYVAGACARLPPSMDPTPIPKPRAVKAASPSGAS